MLSAASQEVCGWVSGVKSSSEQKELKKGKQQVLVLKYLFDNQELHPNTEQYYYYHLSHCHLKAGCAQQYNFYWVVTPLQAQT